MKCPIDQTTLQMTERQGIEIDWCPTCRGVWLDRGELDKIVERSGAFDDRGGYRDDDRRRYDDDDRYEGGRDSRRRTKRKRESFLDELFDF